MLGWPARVKGGHPWLLTPLCGLCAGKFQQLDGLTLDGRNPAPPKKRWIDDFLVITVVQSGAFRPSTVGMSRTYEIYGAIGVLFGCFGGRIDSWFTWWYD